MRYALFMMKLMFLIVFLFVFSIMVLRSVNQFNWKIDGDYGIDDKGYVNINGIDHYLRVRGKNEKNPIILFVHGGPGFPLTYLSPTYQKDLEEDYIMVSYDQRGAGRTYYNNASSKLTPDIMVKDLDAIVDYLREKYSKDQVIIMGQSWGTVLGIQYVHEYPEKVMAYIGVGQVVDFNEGKVLSANTAIEKASKEDAESLRRLAESFEATTCVDGIEIPDLEEMIILSLKYLKSDSELSGLSMIFKGLTSPEMNYEDMRWFMNASSTETIFRLEKPLVEYMYYDFDLHDLGYNFEVPIYFISGDADWITPYPLVEDYYKEVSAPSKGFEYIVNAGHTPFLDHPDQFADSVMRLLEK